MGEQARSLPIDKILDLLSCSVKVKSDRDLYRRLYAYLKSFSEKIDFSIYQKNQNEFELVEGPEVDEREVFEGIRAYQLPKLFIGKRLTFEQKDGGSLAALPVYRSEPERGGVESWLVCRFPADVGSQNAPDIVFNNYFFKRIENFLVYRKSVERVSDYIRLANTDDVTGLFNQRKLLADLDEAVERHSELEKTFSVMFIDVDHFKKVNDNFGHIVGSQMLIEIAIELKKVLRSTDKIYRYGGDEFVVIMPEAPIHVVHKVAVRVREKVKEKSFNIGEAKNYQLSLSIGIAEFPTDAKTAKEIIDFADAMMYVSKKSGRGKVFHVSEVDDEDLADAN